MWMPQKMVVSFWGGHLLDFYFYTHFHTIVEPHACIYLPCSPLNALPTTYIVTSYIPYLPMKLTYGAFTLDVKSMLNEDLGGILGGTQC
jgi:hypothetical protein